MTMVWVIFIFTLGFGAGLWVGFEIKSAPQVEEIPYQEPQDWVDPQPTKFKRKRANAEMNCILKDISLEKSDERGVETHRRIRREISGFEPGEG